MQSRNQKEQTGEELLCHKGNCSDEKSKAMIRLKSALDHCRRRRRLMCIFNTR
jgi:hypothetical protein